MKKIFVILSAVLLCTSCSQKSQSSSANQTDEQTSDSLSLTQSDTLVYQGEGPAADGTYYYKLCLYGDSITEFSFEQVGETPQGTDTVARSTGLANLFSVNGKQYVRVLQNKPDSITFLQLDNTTLRLVGSDLKEAESAETNTDLKLQQ